MWRTQSALQVPSSVAATTTTTSAYRGSAPGTPRSVTSSVSSISSLTSSSAGGGARTAPRGLQSSLRNNDNIDCDISIQDISHISKASWRSSGPGALAPVPPQQQQQQQQRSMPLLASHKVATTSSVHITNSNSNNNNSNNNVSLSSSLHSGSDAVTIESLRRENKRLHQSVIEGNVALLRQRDEMRSAQDDLARAQNRIRELEAVCRDQEAAILSYEAEFEQYNDRLAVAHHELQNLRSKNNGGRSTPSEADIDGAYDVGERVAYLAQALSTTRYLAHVLEHRCRHAPLPDDMIHGNPEEAATALQAVASRTTDDVVREMSELLLGMETLLCGYVAQSSVDPEGCAMQ
eukprot:PhM_4_TR5347/c0_g1_i1/m.101525